MDVRTGCGARTDVGGDGQSRPRRAWAFLMRIVARLREDLTRPAINRRVVHRLSVLSDRELKDIGLVRQDVFDASLPENGDATCFLLRRRDEARHRRRGVLRQG